METTCVRRWTNRREERMVYHSLQASISGFARVQVLDRPPAVIVGFRQGVDGT
jgi:hypothetical protein